MSHELKTLFCLLLRNIFLLCTSSHTPNCVFKFTFIGVFRLRVDCYFIPIFLLKLAAVAATVVIRTYLTCFIKFSMRMWCAREYFLFDFPKWNFFFCCTSCVSGRAHNIIFFTFYSLCWIGYEYVDESQSVYYMIYCISNSLKRC